jgi:hypothetical protein
MPEAIIITIDGLAVRGQLFESACARAVSEVLPLTVRPQEWGDEFYFEIPLALPSDETATVSVRAGDIGYWPPGRALALFFGPTPMSTGPDPVPASEVNIIGRISGDVSLIRSKKGAREIRIERA